jgi:hypothetical protein
VRKTIKNLFVEYGTIAVVVYFVLFFAVWIGIWAAIRAGWQPTSTIGGAGTWTAAYFATKLTQPLRIAATLAVTPFLARFYERTMTPIVTKWYTRVTGRPPSPRLKEVARDEQ